ncbi:MAG TPA: acyl-CoA dehydrogenase family protein [Allosphingosinicella sp.]|nr:acyl-CoA dehydrogenase family protein [Allosphingosinicella sp.]
MRGVVPRANTRLLAMQFEAAPGLARLRALKESFGAATPDLVQAVLDEAARFASDFLAPLNEVGDREGCALVGGRVRTPPGHREAYEAYVAGGWPTLDQPIAEGGQGLPLALAFAVQELFDRDCPAFGMLPVPQRSAARLIAAHGDAQMKAEWLSPLASGAWAATICISEAEAGSDVGRLRTRAEPLGNGEWAITGEKTWISFGDHDLAARIGHCLLARTATADGLSLFLVPDRFGEARNGVVVRRIEEKLGLHASPTCALGFEAARGRLIGAEGRGLQQMFVMITNMRLATGAQGLAIAAGAADLALAYARERRQGGGAAGPIPINRHADVQRMLLQQAAKVEVLRGLLLAAANLGDLAACETQEEERKDAAALLQWLLPLVKTTGGEFAFDVASDAVQVLGGAGYTREWPAEQMLRDARVLTIFEGTTGMQALDLLHRRLRGDRRGLRVFLARARKDAAANAAAGQLLSTLDLLEDAAERLAEMPHPAAEAGATAFLQLAALAATGWIAARLAGLDEVGHEAERLRAAGRHWLAQMSARAAVWHAQSTAGLALIEGFAAIDADGGG